MQPVVETSSAGSVELPRHRPISQIVDEIRREWHKVPATARPCLAGLDKLEWVGDAAAYRGVAELRCHMHPWRSNAARRLKAEIEVILSHYRAAQSD